MGVFERASGYEEAKARSDAQRLELARQRAADRKEQFDLYVEALPEGSRKQARSLEIANVVLRRILPERTPTVNDLIKIAEYVEFGDTSLASAEITAEKLLRRQS